MIRAAIEIVGAAMIVGAAAAAGIYAYYKWRLEVRKLKRADAADEASYSKGA